MNRFSERSRTVCYLSVFITPVFTAIAVTLTWPLFEVHPVAIFLVGTIITACLGGLWRGVISAIASFLISDFFFYNRINDFAVNLLGNAWESTSNVSEPQIEFAIIGASGSREFYV